MSQLFSFESGARHSLTCQVVSQLLSVTYRKNSIETGFQQIGGRFLTHTRFWQAASQESGEHLSSGAGFVILDVGYNSRLYLAHAEIMESNSIQMDSQQNRVAYVNLSRLSETAALP